MNETCFFHNKIPSKIINISGVVIDKNIALSCGCCLQSRESTLLQ